jgi:hypothetical protein
VSHTSNRGSKLKIDEINRVESIKTKVRNKLNCLYQNKNVSEKNRRKSVKQMTKKSSTQTCKFQTKTTQVDIDLEIRTKKSSVNIERE